MKIYPSIAPNFYKLTKEKNQQETSTPQSFPTATTLSSQFNDHLVFMGARVDKGLERFYDANKERMPQTVKVYVENLSDKSSLTPLEAQQKAFELLEASQTIDDIKSAYPEEQLFAELKNPNQTKARRGILNAINENEEFLSRDNKSILKDKSNLTIYLVKKVFLENKSIEEINADLEKDLDEDFKLLFKINNEDSQYVHNSTLAALGIKTPQAEYRQSLRYTKDGYSDAVGAKITAGQRAFWDSLSEADRTARAKKSVEQFENWWDSLTRNQILDMLADQTTELEMLQAFKKHKNKTGKLKPEKPQTPDTEKQTDKPREKTKVGSQKLSQDELFIKWATNNLKAYTENMSDYEKDLLNTKRMQRMTARWAEMTEAERTDYISKMKSGSEPLRYTMIDAWNHSTDLIKDLSTHLKENQIYKPADMLYSDKEFSEFQSKVMTEFWAIHPEHANALGNNIKESQDKIQASIQSGTFEELKKQIMREKNQRVKEMEKFKQENTQIQTPKRDNSIPEYFQDFKNAYYNNLGAQLKHLPAQYINDYFAVILNGFSQEAIEAWTKNIKGEQVSDEEIELLKHIKNTEPAGSEKINRALEAVLADTLYECTKNPEVYLFSHSDAKIAITQIARGQNLIKIGSLKNNREFEMPLIKNKIDQKRISVMYNKYAEPLSSKEIDSILTSYYSDLDGETKDQFVEYIQTYGKSANIIFSDKSAFPNNVKQAMYIKFIDNMPNSLEEKIVPASLLSADPTDFEREEKIKHVKFAFSKKFDFVPSIYMDDYVDELGKTFRKRQSQVSTDDFINLCCAKRKDQKSNGKIAVLPKQTFSIMNKMRTLAMEEALADALYDSTGNTDVYKLSFEELCDNIELFSLVKKFPSETRHFRSHTGESIDLTVTKKLDLKNLRSNYIDYINDIVDWVNTEVKDAEYAEFEDLLFILNPDENMPEKDKAVSERILKYNLKLKHTIYPQS